MLAPLLVEIAGGEGATVPWPPFAAPTLGSDNLTVSGRLLRPLGPAFAPLLLTLFALSVRTERRSRRLAAGAVAYVAFVGYYALGPGEILAHHAGVPAFAVAWLPNILFAGVSARNLIGGTRSTAPDAR